MNDPSSAISAPPPRYLLESDSSDEEGQGAYGGSSSTYRRSTHQPSPAISSVRIEWVGNIEKRSLTHSVLGIGQAGRYILRKAGIGGGKEDVKVMIGDVGVGKGWAVGNTLVLVINDDLGGETSWELSRALMKEVKVDKWIIIGTYVPTMYIPDLNTPRHRDSQAPIRHLRRDSEKSQSSTTWDSPNYLTGTAATFVSMATHPAFPLKPSQLSTIILPLPLSGLSTQQITAELSEIAPELSTAITRAREVDHEGTVWDDMDDEPHSGVGMGGEKSFFMLPPKEDMSVMYM